MAVNAGTDGVIALTYRWKCLACEEGGEGDDANKAAEKHTVKVKHATRAWAVPYGQAANAGGDGAPGARAVAGSVRTMRSPSAEGSPPPPAAEGDGRVHDCPSCSCERDAAP